MRAEEFAARLQASFDTAFGSGTSTVKVLGPSPDDVKSVEFDVMVRPPFGAAFDIQQKVLREQEVSAEQFAMLAYQLSRGLLEPVEQFSRALTIAQPEMFVPDAEVEEVSEPVEGLFQATKKPVTIEAMLFDGSASSATPIINWILETGASASFDCPLSDSHPECADGNHFLSIRTLEGDMKAMPGDYVIRGVQGEFYPCKPDIFAATYDIGGAS